MKITNIQESGNSNVLRWATKNGANLINDRSIQGIINNETFYVITISDVNFFELFRLTQIYREKVRVIEFRAAAVPTRTFLHEVFNGEYIKEDNSDEKMQFCEMAEFCIENFISLTQQMMADNDIIRPEVAQMFLPMISRSYDIQIPIDFISLLEITANSHIDNEIFNSEYPNTLHKILTLNEGMVFSASDTMRLNLVRDTTIIKYGERYEALLNLIKYKPLTKNTSNDLIKFALSGFYKYDNITRSECRCELFNANKEEMGETMKKMKSLNTPLKVEFVVQIPLQYMQKLENTYTREELGVAYESSMSNIIATGLDFHDFITHNYEAGSSRANEYNNAIEMYKERVNSMNQALLNTITIFLQNGPTIDVTQAMSMLPSIYMTKAVVTIDTSLKSKYLDEYDPEIKSMFTDMFKIAESIL